MKTFDDESLILEFYRSVPSSETIFFGRYFHCLRIKWLTKSGLLSKTWTDSSAKSDPPPDFHNNKFHTMMEMMRVDDCVNTVDGMHVPNSFERANIFMKKRAGKDYKKALNGSLFFIPDTRNSDEFNFQGYISNFERVITKHSNKVSEYRKNYPKCKTTVFFICDESDNYVQVSDKEDLKREDEHNVVLKNFLPHHCYLDERFLEIIKNCQADYVIWMFRYKCLFVNGKKISHPMACIYDVKHLTEKGYPYDHSMMFKVKEEVNADNLNGG